MKVLNYEGIIALIKRDRIALKTGYKTPDYNKKYKKIFEFKDED